MSARKATSVRYPDGMLERAEKLAERMREKPPEDLPPTCKFSRSDVILMALERGLVQLEAHYKVKGAAT